MKKITFGRRAFGVLGASVFAMLLGALVAPAHAADQCPMYHSPQFLTANWNQGYAGVPTTVTIQVLDPGGCITGSTLYFNGGSDAQTVGGNLSRNGSTTVITGTFTPQVATYTMNVYYSYWFNSIYGGDRIDMPSTAGGRYTLPSSGTFQPMPAPSAPGTPQVTTNNRTLIVTWSAPGTNPGAVARYSLKNTTNGTEVCAGDSSLRTCTIENAADGSYAFTATAVNSQGQGGTSGASTPVLVAPPNPPSIASASVKGSTARLWLSTTSGTTAVGTALRLLTTDGREVWSTPLTGADVVAGSKLAQVRLVPGRPTQFVARLETPLGAADSAPSQPLVAKVTKKPKR